MSSDPGPQPEIETGDPLSDVLRTVRLSGAIFFVVDATTPWCVDVPAASSFSRIILPQAQHIVSYHVVVEGKGFASIPGMDPIQFDTGDVIVFPHADPYVMQSALGVPPEFDAEQMVQFFRDMACGKLPFVVSEGGGGEPNAKFVCGFLGCDARPFNPLLDALSRLIHIRNQPADENDLLAQLVRLTLSQTRAARAGSECLRLGLSELMFVEAIRRHLAALPPNGRGWLAGLRDAVVGRALTNLHRFPANAWTLDSLAREVGSSRSVLAERFTLLVGRPPMQYLTAWRIQLAARALGDGKSIGTVAHEVGYSSESAFSRTFKKVAGVAPSQWKNSAT